MKVLIIGATGMLGYSLFTNLSELSDLDVYGTVRDLQDKESYFVDYTNQLVHGINANDIDSLRGAFETIQPNIVINCVGLIKQHYVSKLHVGAVKINALLPHELAVLCDEYGARLIHFSTDCVFDGTQGLYKESDLPTATDLYGKSKCLGEVDYGRHLTIRTSIIGHELSSSVSLVDWFLRQHCEVNGFSKAIFSGLPTCYIAKLLAEKILLMPELVGLYHLSVEPIDKFTLISLIADVYDKQIVINKSEQLVIDRSLDSTLLRSAIDFKPPSWRELIEYMNADYIKRYQS